MKKFVRFANALFVLVLMAVLGGAYSQQFFRHEMPCPLCMLQRVALFGVSIGLAFNIRNGLSPKHYGFSLLFAIFGASTSLRQIALHICPGFPSFGLPVWGLSLYTWAFLVAAASIFAIGLLLILYPKDEPTQPVLNWFDWLALLCLLVVLLINCYTTLSQCGLGLCEDVPWPQA